MAATGIEPESLKPVGWLRRLQLLQPLAGRDFRLVWIGQTLSLLGDNIHFVALTWLMLRLTGSGFALGSVLMVSAIPRAVFMVVGGALSDRLSPRSLMLGSNAVRALLIAVMAGLVLVEVIQLWQIYLLAAAFGVVDAFFYPAAAAIVPSLVAEHRLAAGNALMRGTMQLSGLVGPALGGVLIAAAGTGNSFVLVAVGYALATGSLVLMRGGRKDGRPLPGSAVGGESVAEAGGPEGAEEPSGLLSAIGAGLRYAWGDPVIRAILLGVAAIDFSFVGPFTVGLASLADRRFDAGSVGFGVMLSGLGGGALLGTIIGGSIGQLRRRGRIMIGLVSVMGLGLALMGFAPNVETTTLLTGVMGMGAGLINVIMPTWLQTRTDPRMLGRVMSLVMFASAGLAPLSYAVAGGLADLHATVLFAAAGGLVMVAAAVSASSRAVRSID